MRQVGVWRWLGLGLFDCVIVAVSPCERRGDLDTLASEAYESGLRCDNSREL